MLTALKVAHDKSIESIKNIESIERIKSFKCFERIKSFKCIESKTYGVGTMSTEFCPNCKTVRKVKLMHSWQCCMGCNPANGRVDIEVRMDYKTQVRGLE